MKRNVISILLAVFFVFSLSLSAQASSSLPMVVDHAELLNPSEETSLESLAQELRTEYKMDIVILTVDSLEGKSAQTYADDYYDGNGYGYDEDGSGILLLLAMEEREWYISTCGDAIYALRDYGIQQIEEEMVRYLSDGDYEAGFRVFLTSLPEYINPYGTGRPADGYADYSGDYYHGERENVVYHKEEYSPSFLLSLIIGIVAATVVILIMRFSMNTRRQQRGAGGYLKAGSFHLKRHQDIFLYSNVSKARRQQNNPGGGGGRGSSVHHSSGGRRHGGGGGRF